MLTEQQIKQIASEISIVDVYEYVKNHQKEYEEYINNEAKKKDNNFEDPYDKVIEKIVINGKLEVPIKK